jgi:hypothetical protein
MVSIRSSQVQQLGGSFGIGVHGASSLSVPMTRNIVSLMLSSMVTVI